MSKPRKTKKQIKKTKKNRPKGVDSKLWAKTNLILLIATLIAVFLAFLPVLNSDFVNFDDQRIIINNPVVTGTPHAFVDFFTSGLFNAHYKPITYMSWYLEYKVWGLNPTVFHLNNLILHMLNVLLLILIGFRMLKYVKIKQKAGLILIFGVALLWAIHPMKVESVAWTVERKDVLYTFFYFAAALAYFKYVMDGKFKWIILTSLFYLMSIWSKSMGITFVLIPFFIDYISNRKPYSRKSLISKWPLYLVFLFGFYIFGLFHNFAMQAPGISAATPQLTDFDVAMERDPANLSSLPMIYQKWLLLHFKTIFWIVHVLFPIKLSIIYPRKEILESLGWMIHLFPLINLAIAWFAFKWRKKWPFILFCGLLYLVLISPALGIMDFGRGIFISDRYAYMPSLAILTLMAAGIYFVVRNWAMTKKIAGVVLATVVFVFLISTYNMSKVWQNSETLWTNTIEKFPNVMIAYNNRGLHYAERGQLVKAATDFNKAIEINPENFEAHFNMANIYGIQRKFQESIDAFTLALKHNESLHQAYLGRGHAYIFTNRLDLALNDFSNCIAVNTNALACYLNRGKLYLTNYKNYALAISDLSKVLELDPDHGEGNLKLANAYYLLGDKANSNFYGLRARQLGQQVPDIYFQ